MSRKENCHDHSVMANLFGIMRQKMYYDRLSYSYKDFKVTIEKSSIKYYNKQRIKEKLE